MFSALPAALAKQGVVEFQLIPIFFNIGINEQAVLADKFGDMSAVNATNNESFERLQSYHRRFQKIMSNQSPGGKSAFIN